MEASALQAPAGLTRGRGALGSSFLRLRSDDQLVALFRAGNDDAFRVIHDRYRTRLFAYTRQMLPGSPQDAEDALQDVFLKAYSGLRAHDRQFALRAWLYRVAHNRCIDQLRRPVPLTGIAMEERISVLTDPIAAAEQRETLRRLIADVQRLPDHQRSALLMRELSGMSYAELAEALALSVPAVKSLLVRARLSLAAALEARETACSEIREELVICHDRGVRPTPMARRHLRDCPGCRDFRRSVRGVSRSFAAIVPAAGPAAMIGKLLGIGGGAAAGSSGAAAGGSATASGVAASAGALGAGGAIATGLMTTSAGHVASLLAAAVLAAGGTVAIEPGTSAGHHHVRPIGAHPASTAAGRGGAAYIAGTPVAAGANATQATGSGPAAAPVSGSSPGGAQIGAATARRSAERTGSAGSGTQTGSMNLASPDSIAGIEQAGLYGPSGSAGAGDTGASVAAAGSSTSNGGTTSGATAAAATGTSGSGSTTGTTGSNDTGSSSTGSESTGTGGSSSPGTGSGSSTGSSGGSTGTAGSGSTSSSSFTGDQAGRASMGSL